jgi:hypothetical protein
MLRFKIIFSFCCLSVFASKVDFPKCIEDRISNNWDLASRIGVIFLSPVTIMVSCGMFTAHSELPQDMLDQCAVYTFKNNNKNKNWQFATNCIIVFNAVPTETPYLSVMLYYVILPTGQKRYCVLRDKNNQFTMFTLTTEEDFIEMSDFLNTRFRDFSFIITMPNPCNLQVGDLFLTYKT